MIDRGQASRPYTGTICLCDTYLPLEDGCHHKERLYGAKQVSLHNWAHEKQIVTSFVKLEYIFILSRGNVR